VKDHILPLLAKTMDHYVFPILAQCDTTTVTFHLWMLRMGFDTFALVVNFLSREWVPCHVVIGLFKAPNTSGTTLAKIIKPLLAKFELMNKVITMLKERQELGYPSGVLQLERHYEKSCPQTLD